MHLDWPLEMRGDGDVHLRGSGGGLYTAIFRAAPSTINSCFILIRNHIGATFCKQTSHISSSRTNKVAPLRSCRGALHGMKYMR